MQWQCMLNLSNFSYTMYESKNSAKFRTYTFTQCKIAHKIDWKRSLVLGLQNRYLPFSYLHKEPYPFAHRVCWQDARSTHVHILT